MPDGRKSFIKERKKVYSKLRKKPLYSPALKIHVHFTLRGWEHLTRNRPFNDVVRRLHLLEFVEQIIVEMRIFKSSKLDGYFVLQDTKTREVRGRNKKRIVKVVVLRDDKGKYIFLSVSDSPLY